MSFLTGLYFLGAAAIAFPLVFHLIRRRPQHRLPFSTLMFLTPSPPRLTKRSRIDHLFLLLLRAVAILLVAIAFMRPFYRQFSEASGDEVRGRRIAILLDTSASMRRGNLWNAATQLIEAELNQWQPADDVALFTFADRVTTIVGFSEATGADVETRSSLVRKAMMGLAPTWAHTDVGTALMTVAESLEASSDRTHFNAASQILLISDMQEGSQLQSLDRYQWPQEIRVVVNSVAPQPALSNATLRLLVNRETEERVSITNQASPERRADRVRVENSSDALTDQFDVHWASADGATKSDVVSIHVPAGQSRVVGMPQSAKPSGADRLVLSGDDSAYDNQYFVSPTHQEIVRCIYVGNDDGSDPEGLLFYLKLALPETRRTRVDIEAIDEGPLRIEGPDAPRLVVVGKTVSGEQQQAIEQYVRQGGTVLVVLQGGPMLTSLGSPFEGWTCSAAKVDIKVDTKADSKADSKDSKPAYALLADIDFEHGLMAPFAGSRYGDFTMIRFWHHRQVVPSEGSSTHVIASFDTGHPALIDVEYRHGKYLLLTSGWEPRDSQLARSWKFAVLLSKILSRAGGAELIPSLVVNQSIVLPLELPAKRETRVLRPDASEVRLAAGNNRFDQTNLPGIYRAQGPQTVHEFAVNLSAAESRTAPLSSDQLEMFGVQLGRHATQSDETARLRQLLDIELEGEQQVWRWLILASLLLLIFETWLAGHYARNFATTTAPTVSLVAES